MTARRQLSILLLGTCVAGTSAAGELRLPDLEARADTSGAMRLAGADLDIAQAREALAEASGGARLFGTGAISNGRDATRPERYRIFQDGPDGNPTVTEQTLVAEPIRRNRASVLVGIRIPLFGSRAAAERERALASSNTAVQQIKREVVRQEVLKALRYAYVEAYYRDIQRRVLTQFLDGKAAGLEQAIRRRDAHVMLESEMREIQAMYAMARQQQATADAAETAARARLALLSGVENSRDSLAPPRLPEACMDGSTLEASAGRHPTLRHLAEVARQKHSDIGQADKSLVTGGLNISQGTMRENRGRSGYTTALSLDVDLPFNARQMAGAQARVALAEASQADLLLEQRRSEYLESMREALRTVPVQRARADATMLQLSSAAEAANITGKRAGLIDPEAEQRMQQTRFAVIKAALEATESALQGAKLDIDLLGLAPPCAGTAVPESVEHGQPEQLLQALSKAGLAQAIPSAGLPGQGFSAQPRAACTPGPECTTRGWYAWSLLGRIGDDGERLLAALPPTERILLSLAPDELAEMGAGGEQRRQLVRFLRIAAGRNIRVELLLGDPHWVLTQQQQRLIQLVKSMANMPFAGIHLDIERAQLAPARRSEWDRQLVPLVASLHAATKLPLGLSLHPRDLDNDALIARLAAAGLSEVTIMAYTTNPQRLATRMRPLMRRHPSLRYSIGQSIEPQLPAAESYAGAAPGKREAAWAYLNAQLGHEQNFSGVVLQSLDHYLDGHHENQL